jgi:hypothetical protein
MPPMTQRRVRRLPPAGGAKFGRESAPEGFSGSIKQ